jgi:hypothetical protein
MITSKPLYYDDINTIKSQNLLILNQKLINKDKKHHILKWCFCIVK